MSSAGSVADIKSRLPVAEIVGETVTLKRAGSTWKGLCPFHVEKTPSFTVSPERESWHCFGCGEHGDIFTFVMKRDGIDFREALGRLAERAGVELSAAGARLPGSRTKGFSAGLSIQFVPSVGGPMSGLPSGSPSLPMRRV